ncbi:Tn3 family transposase [Streptomyces tubercidicus]|uniref:Tn3 family transposase n=1 Tax=Streptomyces tubercidicus TaxID=47759 RepID=UPI003465B42C
MQFLAQEERTIDFITFIGEPNASAPPRRRRWLGHATASLIVGRLSASSRQNTLAAALKEYGALRRTVYAARYLADETYRRKIARQLNKGESLHSLRRSLLYAHEGAIRHRHLAAQTEQAWCLTLLINSVVTWTTETTDWPSRRCAPRAGRSTTSSSRTTYGTPSEVLRAA